MRGRLLVLKPSAFLGMVAPLAALLAFVSLSALYALGGRDIYAAIVTHWGVGPFPFGVTFGDMHGLLAAWQCHRMDVDVVVADPCDVLHRSFNYSPLWLVASPLGLGVSATLAVGWISGLAFLLCLFLLPPPRRASEAPLIVLATLSPMVVFAVERANPDTIIFMLALATGYLALRSTVARCFAYGVGLLAGLLKYYPLTLLLLTLRERISTFLVLNFGALLLILLFVAAYFSDLERGLPLIASGSYYGDFFAAKNLPFGIAEVVSSASGGASYRFLAIAVYGLLFLLGAANSTRLIRATGLRLALAKLSAHESIFLAIGGILIVGCFFAGQNIGYRGIFLLFVLPGLLAIARNGDETTQGLFKSASALVVLLMWSEFFRINMMFVLRGLEFQDGAAFMALLAFWLVRELAWWCLISILAAAAAWLLSQSEVACWLSTTLARRSAVSPRS